MNFIGLKFQKRVITEKLIILDIFLTVILDLPSLKLQITLKHDGN